MVARYFNVLEFRELESLGDFSDVRIVPQQEIIDRVRGARATFIAGCGDVELVRDLDSSVIGHWLLLTPAHLGRGLSTDHISFHKSVKYCQTGVWYQVHQPVHRFDATIVDAYNRLQDKMKRRRAAHRWVRLRQERISVPLPASLELAALNFDK